MNLRKLFKRRKAPFDYGTTHIDPIYSMSYDVGNISNQIYIEGDLQHLDKWILKCIHRGPPGVRNRKTVCTICGEVFTPASTTPMFQTSYEDTMGYLNSFMDTRNR